MTQLTTERNDDVLGKLVVRTPTISIRHSGGELVWAKQEFLQPSGSTKDRVAAFVLTDAISRGAVHDHTTVVEASSGSTSIAFAMACARLELPFVAVLPDNVCDERMMIIRRYGGEIVLTPAAEGVGGAIAEAERRAAVDNRVFLPRQFTNPLNSQAHEVGTGRELIEQLDGRIDAFVAGVGTGGTLAGVGAALRAAGIDALVVEARPTTNAGEPCRVCGGIPGIVPGMSGLLDADEADRTIAVTEAEAVGAARRLCAMGLPVGLSSGLNVVAAAALVAELPPGSRVATVLPDRMERYFSAELFDDLVMA